MNAIDNYIATFPPGTQEIMQTIRKLIHEEVPDAVEAMKYGIPTFVLKSKNLVHFAGYATHIGFYPTPSGIAHFKNEFGSWKYSKGAVQLPIDEPIPLDLIRRMVRFRVEEVISPKGE